MGVWHVAGLGKSAGAFTLPLSYVYLLQKARREGSQDASVFFSTSGEREQRKEMSRGLPEAFVIFTSREVIEGTETGYDFVDEWFATRNEANIPGVICRYLSALMKHLGTITDFPEAYFVAVDHTNFDYALPPIYATLRAIGTQGGKEVWANVVGGTNLINAAVLTAGTLSGAVSRYYYVFEANNKHLHPDISKPRSGQTLITSQEVNHLLRKWVDLPLFELDYGRLYRGLTRLFKQHNQQVPLARIVGMLKENGLDKQYLPKLRGRLIEIQNDDETARPGPLYGKLETMMAKTQTLNNASKWKQWAADKGILWECDRNGKITHVTRGTQ